MTWDLSNLEMTVGAVALAILGAGVGIVYLNWRRRLHTPS
jgi:hypothetical protein